MNQPDIIFIVLDTQRADRLGCYGYHRPLTPHLDAFAAQSVLFEQAISAAQWTIPSHASMFTGLYPTAHQVTQSNQSLPPDRPHLAEVLQAAGYQTVGFCNNPLVGILDNGFKRGFHTFYNYGGAIPTVPRSSSRFPWPFNIAAEWYTQFLRRISYPIQNFFGQSDLAFSVSLNTWLTPLWSRLARFKGQNERSVQDVAWFLRQRERSQSSQPLFLFLNLMETHLPFWPPQSFIDQVAPTLRTNREARAILHAWNREAYRWAAPLSQPLDELEARVLNDMYDAEVAYQDHYLGQLFDALAERSQRENTMTLVVADHGDSLGEHGYFGHAFVAYQELVHVPMLLHWPAQMAPTRVATPVSTRRVYHTLLDAAGILPDIPQLDPGEIHNLSLKQTIRGQDPEQGVAYADVYPPLNFVRAIEHRQPELLEPFRCLARRQAIVQDDMKLIQVDGQPDELFQLQHDPLELHNRLAHMPTEADQLARMLNRVARRVENQRDQLTAGALLQMDDDKLLQRLRGLGYIE
ncbi:MAG: sulfatase [Anaerolineales bacterium]|nr:sulfatase [Anaerolineales bacterium]MCB8952484.1 sulfatase [Ardenticatenales bacterium]